MNRICSASSPIPAGTSVDRFVTTVDAKRTLIGLTGTDGAISADAGRDASPLLRGERIEWADEAFIYGTTFERAGVFTPEFELAYVNGARDHILFDRTADPLQMNNLFHVGQYRSIIIEMTRRMIEQNRSIETPENEWLVPLAKRQG